MSTLGTKEQRTCTLNWSELALPPVSAAGLDAAFTEEEIWAAIAEMPAEKAPGPDGFTCTFNKFCWPIIKGDVTNAFACILSLNTGPLHKLNGASIVLLPKKEAAEAVKDYRPISLIHSFAKIVSKVLAMRLSQQINSSTLSSRTRKVPS